MTCEDDPHSTEITASRDGFEHLRRAMARVGAVITKVETRQRTTFPDRVTDWTEVSDD